MIQIKLLKKCQYGKRGDVVYVSRNVAHGLIERKEGEVYKPKKRVYKNRMMSSVKTVKKGR